MRCSTLRRMKGFLKLTKVSDALSIIMKACGEVDVGSECLDVREAWGRVLEKSIVSPVNVPPFDRSAVDGYAVKSEDCFSASQSNPAVFFLKGTTQAGGGKGEIRRGESFEIYTGAPIPLGADAVVMAEDCEKVGDKVNVYRSVPKFANISLMGEDVRSGSTVMPRGEIIRPWHIGVLASVGTRKVIVRKRVMAGVFATGSELIDLSDIGNVDRKIVDSTRPMIIGLLKEAGCEVKDGGIVPDELETISSKISELERNADLIISIGGTSVGGMDLVPEAAKAISERGVMFHGLAAKPGKPTGFGMIGGKAFFMLPGYPVSALVGYECLIAPLIAKWSGFGLPKRDKVKAEISRRVATTPGIRHFLRVTLRKKGDALVADPIALTGSGLLSSITSADGVVIIPEDVEGVEEGDEVEVEIFGGFK